MPFAVSFFLSVCVSCLFLLFCRFSFRSFSPLGFIYCLLRNVLLYYSDPPFSALLFIFSFCHSSIVFCLIISSFPSLQWPVRVQIQKLVTRKKYLQATGRSPAFPASVFLSPSYKYRNNVAITNITPVSLKCSIHS